VVAVTCAEDNKYWLWEGGGGPRLMPAEPIVISSADTRATPAARYAT